jgi:hypothetical protein
MGGFSCFLSAPRRDTEIIRAIMQVIVKRRRGGRLIASPEAGAKV